MGIFSSTSDNLLSITKLLDERESRFNSTLEKYMQKEDTKLDKVLEGFSYLKGEFNTLNQSVVTNHLAAMSSINDKKHEITKEVSSTYALKIDLEEVKKDCKEDISEGLNSIRKTAKIIWTVVGTCVAVAIFLSSKNIL